MFDIRFFVWKSSKQIFSERASNISCDLIPMRQNSSVSRYAKSVSKRCSVIYQCHDSSPNFLKTQKKSTNSFNLEKSPLAKYIPFSFLSIVPTPSNSGFSKSCEELP